MEEARTSYTVAPPCIAAGSRTWLVRVLGAVLTLSATTVVTAQVAGPFAGWESGLPHFTARYGPREYQAHRQNWAIVQSDDGVIWVGNTEGLLRFDGVSWRRTPIRGGAVRSLALGDDGRIYVGGVGTFGVVAASAGGLPTYVELAGPAELHGADVWATVTVNGRIYFQTSDVVYTYDGTAVRLVSRASSGKSFHRLFAVPGESGMVGLYVRQETVGLLRLAPSDGRFQLIPGGNRFREDKIWALFWDPDAGLLAFTATQLISVRNGRIEQHNSPQLSNILSRHRIYDGVLLGNGLFALGTLGAGVLIVNSRGDIVQRIGDLAGLTEDDLVLDLATDNQSGLWLALANGIARFDAVAPLTEFASSAGLPGTTQDLARHRGELYAGTDIGLYRLGRPETVGEAARFQRTSIRDQTWSLFALEDHILVATTAGVYAVDELARVHTVTNSPSYVVKTTTNDPNIAYVGTDGGIDLLLRDGEGWRSMGSVEDVSGEVRSIIVDDNGFVWAATPTEVLRIRPWSEAINRATVVARYDLMSAILANVRGVAIVSRMAVRRPHPGGRLVVDEELTDLFTAADSTRALAWTPDASGRLWLSQGGAVRAYEQVGSGPWRDVTPNAMRTLSEGLRAALVEDGALWLGTESGLLRYDLAPGADARYGRRGRVQITSLVDNRQGAIWRGGAPGYAPARQFTISPGTGTIRVDFAAPLFNDAGATRFRTRLAGYEESWTSWGPEPWREFTRLPPGSYSFEVEAVSGQGVAQLPAAVMFIVEPLWHETWWARIALATIALLVVVGIAQQRVRVHRLNAEAERMRANQFALMNQELQEADKLKDELLANTSHELRTPLTAILGYADLLTEYSAEEPASEVRETASHILAGANRLFRTVEDMMDAASIRAGRVELFPETTDVEPVVRAVVDRYAAAARQKGISLVFAPGLGATHSASFAAHLDRRALTRIVDHLLDNAIKFTDQGLVRVTLSHDLQAQAIRLEISDSGRGIEDSFVPFLFESFKQQSTGFGRTHEGNGLGLSIVGGLARLMSVQVTVTSTLGVGTTIVLCLPIRPTAIPNAGATTGTQRDLVNPATPPIQAVG